MEARACLQAVTVSEELGFRNLMVEGDSLIVIKKIQTVDGDRSSIAAIIQEIKERAQRFESFTCYFVERSVNHVAHVMAKEGKRWAELRVSIKESPPRTESTTEKDRRSLNDV